MSQEPKPVENTKSCAYCGSPISGTAILCPVCKSYQQSKWRNNFVFWGGLAGLIGLFLSGGAYIISELPTLRKVIAWQDKVNVVEFGAADTKNFSLSATNSGDGGQTRTNLGGIVDQAIANAKRLAGEGKSRLARAALRRTAHTLRQEEEERRASYAERVRVLFGLERDIALAGRLCRSGL